MKRVILCLLAMVLLLTGCSTMAQTELQADNPIPEDGVISAELLERIREENAVAVFSGERGGFSYEWTIFGKELSVVSSVDLRIDAVPAENGLEVRLSQKEPFGFPALLSIHLPEKWTAQSAWAYQSGVPVGTVSLTGSSRETILNLAAEGLSGSVLILPEAEPQTEHDTDKITAPAEPDQKPPADNSYLSHSQTGSAQVYGGVEQPSEGAADISQESARPREEYLSGTAAGNGTVYGKQEVPSQEQKSEETTENYLSGVKQEESHIYGGINQSTWTPESSQKGEDYLSGVEDSGGRVYSDGSMSEKDQYLTDPVPEGKPMPVEPEDQDVDKGKRYTCTFSIECSAILNNLSQLDPDKLEMVPSDGVILPKTTVTFYEGESVFDVLQRVCRENGIHMESSWTPIYNSAYVEGIHNLYEFDCGNLSGWMYRVNGWYPNYGCSRYQLQQGEVVEWRYTCDLGNDVGRTGAW